MARYRRYRRTIIRAPKKKWATNIVDITSNGATYDSENTFHYATILAQNKSESTSPTPVIIKTGNFKAQFDLLINVSSSGMVAATAYIIFLPEGYFDPSITPDSPMWGRMIYNHPEWIMVWRQLDFGNANAAGSVDTSVVRMSSRMKRNLNSGDKIYFVILGTGQFAGTGNSTHVNGSVQYWTCAN